MERHEPTRTKEEDFMKMMITILGIMRPCGPRTERNDLKAAIRLLSGIALAVIVGFTFIACPDGGGDPTVPDIPQNFNSIPGNGEVTLSWTAPASDGGSAITKFEVNRTGAETWVTATSPYTFTGLTNGTSYTFRVRAVNAIGNGSTATINMAPGTATPIGTAAELAAMTLNGNYILTADITITGTWNVIGPGTATPFTGTFNGNGRTITFDNPTFINTATAAFGLFGRTATGSEIKNLRLVGSISFTGSGNNNLGPLVGYVDNGTIRNISSSVNVTTTVNGTFNAWAGGIVGENYGGTIENSYSTGNISATNNATTNIGLDRAVASGIAGSGSTGTVSNCWSAGTISAAIITSNNSAAWAAGLSSSGTINNSVALTTSITITTQGGTANGSRISNSGTRSGNYALDPMPVMLNSTAKTLLKGVTAADGADVTAANANTVAWWRTTAGWTVHDNQSQTSEDSPWYWSGGANPRPILWFETTVNR